MSTRGDIAVAYAERYGWHVLPIWWVNADGTCGCGDAHTTTPSNIGKHPITPLVPSGHLDASRDPGVVRLWWAAQPEANVAVACDTSNLIVIDVDPRNGGDQTLAQFEVENPLPQTMRARTGGGGVHLLYSAPPGVRVRGKLGPGVEVKHHGYVLLAPSNHVMGTYAWDSSGIPVNDLGEALEVLRVGGSVGATTLGSGYGQVEDPVEVLRGTEPGERHARFTSFAASMRARKLRYLEARSLIEMAWDRADQAMHPFPLEEAVALLDWAYERLPEGTTAEVELRKSEWFMQWFSQQQRGAVDPGEAVHTSGGAGPPFGPGSTGANGSTNGQSPTLLLDGTTVEERLLALPQGLREEAILQFTRQEARVKIREIRSELEFARPGDGRSLTEILHSPYVGVEWTVDQLHERGTNTSLTAQFKTGKTTLQLNLIRALADEELFLDRWACSTPGAIGFFNYELTSGTFRRWAQRVGVVHPERVFVWDLRGYRLDLETSAARRWVVDELSRCGISFWLADPLARAYYGDENDNSMLKLWTDAVDEIKREAGVLDFQVTLHTGRAEMEEGEERARGATRIDDWVDGRWLLLRSGGARFFRAQGREIEVDETRLHFTEDDWRLSVDHAAPVSRRVHRDLIGVEMVVEGLRRLGATSLETAVSKSQLRDAMSGSGHQRLGLIETAARAGEIASHALTANRFVYWLAEHSQDPLSRLATVGSSESDTSQPLHPADQSGYSAAADQLESSVTDPGRPDGL